MSLYFPRNLLLTLHQKPFDVGGASSSYPINTEESRTLPSVPEATAKKAEAKTYNYKSTNVSEQMIDIWIELQKN